MCGSNIVNGGTGVRCVILYRQNINVNKCNKTRNSNDVMQCNVVMGQSEFKRNESRMRNRRNGSSKMVNNGNRQVCELVERSGVATNVITETHLRFRLFRCRFSLSHDYYADYFHYFRHYYY